MESKKEFYENVSKILGIPHEYSEPVKKRTRWNNRKLGNGRFKGFGLVRCYGSGVIVISKSGTKVFATYEEVYKCLKSM